MNSEQKRIIVIGHPFSTLGMGGQARSCITALQSVGAKVEIFDVYEHDSRSDYQIRKWLEPLETKDLNNAVRIFHINGDEIERVLDKLETDFDISSNGRNIICPAWELPIYPDVWAKQVSRFDRGWGISKFVTDIISNAVNIKIDWVSQTVDPVVNPSLPRKYFGIRESSHAFLTFFDYSSYVHRKNPVETIHAFMRAFPKNGLDDVQLIMKTNDVKSERSEMDEIVDGDNRIKIISCKYSGYEMNSLISCADTLVSLHRSEGFGRGPAEAILRGKQVIATGYSGTEDYLTSNNSFKIPYNLIDVNPGEYPHWERQQWAQPSIQEAAAAMRYCHKNPKDRTGLSAISSLLTNCGTKSVGLRMLKSCYDVSLK